MNVFMPVESGSVWKLFIILGLLLNRLGINNSNEKSDFMALQYFVALKAGQGECSLPKINGEIEIIF